MFWKAEVLKRSKMALSLAKNQYVENWGMGSKKLLISMKFSAHTLRRCQKSMNEFSFIFLWERNCRKWTFQTMISQNLLEFLKNLFWSLRYLAVNIEKSLIFQHFQGFGDRWSAGSYNFVGDPLISWTEFHEESNSVNKIHLGFRNPAVIRDNSCRIKIFEKSWKMFFV